VAARSAKGAVVQEPEPAHRPRLRKRRSIGKLDSPQRRGVN
jgi:hypothetical protein